MPGFRSCLNTGYFRPAGNGIQVEGSSGEAAETYFTWGAATLLNAATTYLWGPGTSDAASNATLAAGQVVAPFAGRCEALYYHAASGGVGQYDFILQVNGVDSALALLNHDLSVTQDNEDDGVTSISFNKGDLLSIKCVRDSYSSSPVNPTITTRIRPP